MGDDIVGRPVNAVLAPAQAERFATVAGVDLNRLVLNVTGWNKLVLLDLDRVFLFPRSAIEVPAEPEALIEQLGRACW